MPNPPPVQGFAIRVGSRNRQEPFHVGTHRDSRFTLRALPWHLSASHADSESLNRRWVPA